MDDSILEKGKTLCDEMTSSNKNDYLTQKVTTEVQDLISEVKNIPDDIKRVKNLVNIEKEKVRLAELKKKEEENNIKPNVKE